MRRITVLLSITILLSLAAVTMSHASVMSVDCNGVYYGSIVTLHYSPHGPVTTYESGTLSDFYEDPAISATVVEFQGAYRTYYWPTVRSAQFNNYNCTFNMRIDMVDEIFRGDFE